MKTTSNKGSKPDQKLWTPRKDSLTSDAASSKSLVDALESQVPRPGKWSWAVVSLTLIVLTFAVFQQVRGFDFIYFDDDFHVYHNLLLDKSQDPAKSIATVWDKPHGGLYIPVTYTLWTVLAHCTRLQEPRTIFGTTLTADLDPGVFHTANLIVHLLTVLVAFLLIRTLIRNDVAAGAGALLFSIHPVQVEAVAWVSEFKGLVCGFFSLTALWFYVLYAREAGKLRAWMYGAAATLLFLLALLAKPEAAAVPLVAFVLGIVAAGKPGVKCVLLFAWLAAVACVTRTTSSAQTVTDPIAVTAGWMKPIIAGDAIAFYLYKIVCPLQLGIEYGHTPYYVLHQWWGWVWWIVPLALGALLWQLRRRAPWLGVGYLILVIQILPVSGLINFNFQAHSTVADRYLYIAMLGPAIALAWTLSRRRRPALLAFCGIWFLALGVKSTLQTATWKNNLTIASQAVAVNHDSFTGYDNLAKTDFALGRYADSIAASQSSLNIIEDSTAENSLATAYMTTEDYSDAETHFLKAIQLDPNSALAHMNLGLLRGSVQGRHAEAVAEFSKALALDPYLDQARRDLTIEQEAEQGEVTVAKPNQPNGAPPSSP